MIAYGQCLSNGRDIRTTLNNNESDDSSTPMLPMVIAWSVVSVSPNDGVNAH